MDIPPEVEQELGYHVYMYVDPRDNRPFYIGKGGAGSRSLAHLSESNESRKVTKLNELKSEGLEPQIYIVRHGLEREQDALNIEAALIDYGNFLQPENLTNVVRGWKSNESGMISLEEFCDENTSLEAKISHKVILFQIKKYFEYGMSEEELYDITKGVWAVNRKRVEGREYALGVFKGVIKCVFSIKAWNPAGTADYKLRPREEVEISGNWEFVGEKASDEIWNYYVGKNVRHLINNPQWRFLYYPRNSE